MTEKQTEVPEHAATYRLQQHIDETKRRVGEKRWARMMKEFEDEPEGI